MRQECNHKVEITKGASAQFPIWIINFWPYGQLAAVLKKKLGADYVRMYLIRQYIQGRLGVSASTKNLSLHNIP